MQHHWVSIIYTFLKQFFFQVHDRRPQRPLPVRHAQIRRERPRVVGHRSRKRHCRSLQGRKGIKNLLGN